MGLKWGYGKFGRGVLKARAGASIATGIAFISSASAVSANGNNVTTSAINTTGANLIVISESYLNTPILPTDSFGNVYTALTPDFQNILYYCFAPIVGSGHTFTVSNASTFPGISALAFSGAAASPFDKQNGANLGSATTIQPGSVTPSLNNEVIVTGLSKSSASGAMTIDSGFSTPVQTEFNPGNGFGTAISYLIQSTAAAVNPTWTSPVVTGLASTIATFKSA